MIKTPILIVGAGPSGLMLSAQLHRYGAAHVIVDQKEGVTDLSKALAVQARTLEQYQQLGIAETAIAQGFVAKSVRFIVNGRVRAKIPLGEIGAGLSPYPYLFILEQSRNEALILDTITNQGGDVQWGTQVTDVNQIHEGYTGTLKRHDGSSEMFECQYLIGCGGASSPVRHFLGMPFRGGTNEQLFFVADIELEVDLEKQGLLLAINKSEFLAFFPMSGPQQYRAIGVLPQSIKNPDDFSFDDLKDHIEGNFGLPAKVIGHSWHAGYRVHHRIVDNFRSGNAFLVGDAAHIHSPAGGQGMNTGLGDAINLGWKLAGVVNGWCEAKILDSYNDERRPFGVQLVHTTDRAFTMMVSKSWLPRLVRTHILPIALSTVLQFERLRSLMFKTVSQTRISYRGRMLSDGTRSGSIHSGDRFPWFEWDGGSSYDWLVNPGYIVLNFGDAPPCTVADWSGPSTQIDVDGPAALAAMSAGLPRRGNVVVRPDMHVAQIVDEQV
ncbi:MAG: FAD-dependent monooxygenase [Hyphomicrobiaceae bacterium]